MNGRAAVVVACVVLACAQAVASAQEHGAYVGGSLALHVQPHSDSQPLGGRTWGGSVLVGAQVSERLGLEVEAYVSGPFSDDYSYNPGPSWTAHVVAKRRDTFFSFQVRSRLGSLEPVVGLSYVLERPSRHATALGQTYFDDSETRHGVAAVAGLDARVKVARRVSIVPTFRAFVVTSRAAKDDFSDPLGADTHTGRLAFRLGIGARVGF